MVLLQRLEVASSFDPCLWHPSPKHALSHLISRHPPLHSRPTTHTQPLHFHVYPYPAPPLSLPTPSLGADPLRRRARHLDAGDRH